MIVRSLVEMVQRELPRRVCFNLGGAKFAEEKWQAAPPSAVRRHAAVTPRLTTAAGDPGHHYFMQSSPPVFFVLEALVA